MDRTGTQSKEPTVIFWKNIPKNPIKNKAKIQLSCVEHLMVLFIDCRAMSNTSVSQLNLRINALELHRTCSFFLTILHDSKKVDA
jgi:hypothetical protein